MAKGLPQDYKEAYIWLSLAATNGNEEAKEHLEPLKTMLSPEELAEALSRATAFFKQIEERQ
jgi:hypothetical protein